jgi:hypothetical protein
VRTSTAFFVSQSSHLISSASCGWLHTVAVVLEQQRPIARVDGRRRGLWLDGVGVGVGLHESHCVDFRRPDDCASVLQSLELFARRENFIESKLTLKMLSAKLPARAYLHDLRTSRGHQRQQHNNNNNIHVSRLTRPLTHLHFSYVRPSML